MKNLKLKLKRIICKVLFICRLRKHRKYFYEPFIYVYNDGRICVGGMSSMVKFLEKFSVEALIEEDADIDAWKIVNEKYPDYKNFVYFF